MFDKNGCGPLQWRGNAINFGLYLKRETLALSFKYFMSISQPLRLSNKNLKYCMIINNMQGATS